MCEKKRDREPDTDSERQRDRDKDRDRRQGNRYIEMGTGRDREMEHRCCVISVHFIKGHMLS